MSMDKDRVLKQLAEAYDKIYDLEKQRREINKKLEDAKRPFKSLLNQLRMEYQNK